MIIQLNDMLAIGVCGIVYMSIGALWYSPILFGKQWMKLMNIDAEFLARAKQRGMVKPYVYSFISSLITAYVMSWLFIILDVTTLRDAINIALLVFAGFVFAPNLTDRLYGTMSGSLFYINNGYRLVYLIAMAAVLVLI